MHPTEGRGFNRFVTGVTVAAGLATVIGGLIASIVFITGKKDVPELLNETPTPELRSQAGAAATVVGYWSAIDAKMYQKAWGALSTEFKHRRHAGSYDAYLQSREEQRLCSVHAEDVGVYSASGSAAVVHAAIVFRAGDSCRVSRELFTFHLEKASTDRWHIDRVLQGIRPASSATP